MRSVLFIGSLVAVIALAFWAYRENHNTRVALETRNSLQRDIATLSEAIAVQRAEWAYLNRPARLQELVMLNFDRLMLMPLQGSQFSGIDKVAYPSREPDLSDLIQDGIDVFGDFELMSGEHAAQEAVP